MNCIVYVSRESIVFDEPMLVELADLAARRNAEVGITGYLYHYENHFTQYIEGDKKPIDDLWEVLNQDSRHSILAHFQGTVDTPRFAHWHMRRLTYSELVQIRLEDILTENVVQRGLSPIKSYKNPEALWRMVSHLAKFEKQISAGVF